LRPIDALNILCAQLTRDLFAIAKFLLQVGRLDRAVILLGLTVCLSSASVHGAVYIVQFSAYMLLFIG